MLSYFHKFIRAKNPLLLWAILPIFFLLTDFAKDRYNNYKIFRQVFFHLQEGLSLYAPYPSEYFDVNHYGPLFGLIIAPFALLPDIIGVSLWNLANALFLFYAVTKVVQPAERSRTVLLLLTIEMANAMWSCQFNSSVAAMILLSYYYTKEGSDYKATFFMLLGTFIKLYGIVGISFLLFSKNKSKFILGTVLWSVFFLILPMLLTSPSFIFHSYGEWFSSLADKNLQNISLFSDQDISVPGLFRRVFQLHNFPGFPLILIAAIVTGIVFLLRLKPVNDETHLQLCAIILLFPVLFSSGSEHPTYVIAMTGAAIWLSGTHEIPKWLYRCLVFFLVVFSGLGPTDLFGKGLRFFMSDYSLKVLPYFVVWFLIIRSLLANNKTNSHVRH